MKNISVIGAGTMGNGIAHCFAQKGYNVNLIDLSIESLEKAKIKISKNLDRMIKKNIITEKEKNETLEKITFDTKLNENVKNSDLIIEAATVKGQSSPILVHSKSDKVKAEKTSAA